MRTLLALSLVALLPALAAAEERYALIVSGASGGEKYAILQHTWREELTAALTGRLAMPPANVFALDEQSAQSARSGPGSATTQATSGNVRRVLADLRQRLDADDTLLLVLFGHGTIDGPDAKFNLVGPDLTAAEWQSLLDPIAGRLVVVNTTEASYPFIEQLSRKGRIVITATDSVGQRFATAFPEYFVRAVRDPASDLDKDGRVSVWELFSATSNAVKVHYERRGQLATERALIDDDGDRIGHEAPAPGDDGNLARRAYLAPDPGTSAGDPALAALYRERDALQQQLEELRARKLLLSDQQYQTELERLLVQLARVAAEIRKRP
jgi:hypothetical protein